MVIDDGNYEIIRKRISCPLNKKGCGDNEVMCPYLKNTQDFLNLVCDYPFIGKIKAEPDKLPE